MEEARSLLAAWRKMREEDTKKWNTPGQQLPESRTASPLITVKQFADIYPWPSESALRSYIYRAKELGLESSIVRMGRRVLINPSLFFQLIENKR